MAFIWMQTSRANFRVALKRIYEGQTIGFGVISLDRQGVHANDRMYPWSKIDDVELAKGTEKGYVFDLDLKSTKTVSVDAHGVSLPETAFAVCKVMLADTDKIGTDAVQPKEEVNPFAI